MKLLKFQETFPEKFLVSGFGAEATIDNERKKTRRRRVFYFFVMCWNCVPNLLFLPFFRRKVSQRTSHRIHHFTLAKLLKFQETFLEKFLVSGFGAEATTDNEHKKTRRRRVFYFFRNVLELRSKPLFLTFLLEKGKPKNFPRLHHFILIKVPDILSVLP